MIRRQLGDLVFFQFEGLLGCQEVVHAITTRCADPLVFPAGLDLSFATAAAPELVVAARQKVCSALGLKITDLVATRQVHGTRVVSVCASDRGRGALERESAIPETDALTTADRGVVLFVAAADCVPLLFCDPQSGAIAAAHAGWRGTVARIAGETVAAMASRHGINPTRILVGIGPSIGPCCYRVGDEVLDAAAVSFGDGAFASTTREGATHFDLWSANEQALLDAGVLRENIERAGICTACNTDLFFSHRSERGRAGRFGAIIALGETAWGVHDRGAD